MDRIQSHGPSHTRLRWWRCILTTSWWSGKENVNGTVLHEKVRLIWNPEAQKILVYFGFKIILDIKRGDRIFWELKYIQYWMKQKLNKLSWQKKLFWLKLNCSQPSFHNNFIVIFFSVSNQNWEKYSKCLWAEFLLHSVLFNNDFTNRAESWGFLLLCWSQVILLPEKRCPRRWPVLEDWLLHDWQPDLIQSVYGLAWSSWLPWALSEVIRESSDLQCAKIFDSMQDGHFRKTQRQMIKPIPRSAVFWAHCKGVKHLYVSCWTRKD